MRLFETTLARIAATLCLALAMLVPQAGSAQTAYPGFYRIVTCPSSFAIPADQCDNLHGLHNENGKLELNKIQPNWWSAQWEIVDAGSGQFTIRNRYTGEYLAATFNNGLPVADMWQILLVKPDSMITSFNQQSGTVQTRPASDLGDTMVWNIVKGENGLLSIFNSAVIGQHYLFRNGPKTGSLIAKKPEQNSATSVLVFGAKQTDLIAKDGSKMPVIGEAFWQLQSTGEVIIPKDVDIVRILTTDSLALNIETGAPALGAAPPGWLSAQWIEQKVDGGGGPPLTLFKNVWTSKYLGLVNGSLTMMDRTPGAEQQGFSRLPYAWHVTGGNGPYGFASAIKNMVSGQYLTMDAGKTLTLVNSNAPLDGKQPATIWALDDAREAPPPPPPAPDVLVRLELGTDAVNVETGPVRFGATPPNFWSGDWIYEERTGGQRQRLVSLRNRWKNQYLLIRDGAVIMADPANPEVINDPAQMEELWHSVGVNDQGLILRHVRTGLYLGQPNKDNLTVSPTPTTIDKTPWRIRELR